MTTAERLRFLADRIEDGKPFLMNGSKCEIEQGEIHRFSSSIGYSKYSIQQFVNTAEQLELLPTLPELFADDITFLKLAKDCGYGEWWIARDADGTVVLFHRKPTRAEGNHWWSRFENVNFPLHIHSPLLNIKWEDDDCYTINQLLGEKE